MDQKIKKEINGKVILITGGTGSFGNAVVEKLLKLNPKQILIFSRDEKKQLDMANKHRDSRIRFLIGDVRDKERVTYIMNGVDLIFHAAALKQVPNCEFFPEEALLTNTLGAANVINSAVHHGVKRVVILSTDKAVYPINAMGMTKALMERIMIAISREKRNGTILCGTRYGNVMYTRGSVLPYFVELIKKGESLPVTDPNMTRFMMSLEDSVNLVLYALTNGKDGELYVKKAPATTIGNLAKAMKDIFGYKGKIEEIGVRPGEKEHETLISAEELVRTKDCGSYFKIEPEVPGMDIKKYYRENRKKQTLFKEGYTSENTRRLTLEETKKLLLSLPEIRAEIKDFKK